jgi:hypothetical protein
MAFRNPITSIPAAGIIGQITTSQITPGAITTALLAANAITGQTITGGTIIGALIETATSGGRIVLDESRDALFVYATSGALILSVSSAAGTDGAGNAYPAGLNVAGAQLTHLASTAHGDAVLTSDVFGDAYARWVVNADGSTSWGGGTAATDTDLYRAQTGLLATDTDFSVGGNGRVTGAWIKTVSGSETTWQPPTLSTGWASGAAFGNGTALEFRLDAEDNLFIAGSVQSTATWTNGATLWTFTGSWLPKSNWSGPCSVSNSSGSCLGAGEIQVYSATGHVMIHVPSSITPASGQTLSIWGGLIPMKNIA